MNYSWNDGRDDDRPGLGNGSGGPAIPVEQPFFSGAILSLHSGKCMDVEDRSLRDGATVQQ